MRAGNSGHMTPPPPSPPKPLSTRANGAPIFLHRANPTQSPLVFQVVRYTARRCTNTTTLGLDSGRVLDALAMHEKGSARVDRHVSSPPLPHLTLNLSTKTTEFIENVFSPFFWAWLLCSRANSAKIYEWTVQTVSSREV